jgi:hypothetical protein
MAEQTRLRDVARVLHKLQKCLYCYLGPTGGRGIGVFAAREFGIGETVMSDCDGDFFDEVLTLDELQVSEIFDYPLQIGKNAFRIPTGGIEDFTNHSCDPNTGIRQIERGIVVVAIRNIQTHDEITFDYSTWLTTPSLQFECRCGSPDCRGLISDFGSLPDNLKIRYRSLGVVGDFVLEEFVEDFRLQR